MTILKIQSMVCLVKGYFLILMQIKKVNILNQIIGNVFSIFIPYETNVRDDKDFS